MAKASPISTLSAKRRALLQILMEKEGLDSSAIERIPPWQDKGSSPLSFAQKRLWFLTQLESDYNFYYNTQGTFRLEGPLNTTVLEQSLNKIVRRHEVLRTTFPAKDGQPRQAIASDLSISLSIVDLNQLSKTERETEIQRLIFKHIRHRFDLARGPLVHARLLRLNDQEHVFTVVMHHIISDGWSMSIFFRELATLYEAFSTGKPSPLPELPVQYADYAAWQQKWMQGTVLDQHLSYWKKQLAGTPPAIELPTDRPQSARQSFRGARYQLAFPRSLTEAIKALSRQEEATLFMTLLAAFKVLLHRYTRQDDIVVGTAIAGRNRAEVEWLIGCFINTLVLRTDLSGNPTFRELLRRVRKTTLDAYAHQDLPFERLVEELQPPRVLNRTPLFQVIFELQNVPTPSPQMGNITLTRQRLLIEEADFELGMELYETSKGLGGSIEYSTELFDTETIVRMAGHFHTLLESIVTNPDQRLANLSFLTPHERHQLLVEWNDNATEYPQEWCIHQLFEIQVAQTPDAVAVVFPSTGSGHGEDQHLTYQELNRRANQLAHHLQGLGVGPEVLVGICIERSLEMIIGLYGILKAGGAYMPLDPAYPSERQAFMLTDARVSVLLTQETLVNTLPAHEAQVICLDSGWDAIAQESTPKPVCRVVGTNLAYVIYTSGSTGKPKGAMNSHAGIRNRLLWMQDAYHLVQADRVMQKTPLSFDVSVWEFFWPLLTGACLVVARPEGHKDSAYLVKAIVEQEITTIHFVPSMLRLFVQEQQVETCHSLKRVICSGEALPFDLQEQFYTHLDAELHNLYGPTEAAVDVTFWHCERETELQTVPIGRPIANMQIYILDSHLRPVPVGVPGELHIGGIGLARGYHNRPDLTAEKFIPHPFCDGSISRLYRTGDLACYLPDGNIEFLGRMDHQVKIRGFRIELGEIEAVLAGHPTVRETVAVAREDKPGDTRLVAYVIPHAEQEPTVSDLRSFLTQKLPEYMVPSAFVMLDALPLTPNGKVDRRALPEPDHTRPESDDSVVAPRTPGEEILAGIWMQVLGMNQISVYDNFFELGGHSLLATQVMSRTRNALHVELPVRTLFETSTIAGLAKRVEMARRVAQDLQPPPMQPVPRDGDLALSFAQQRLWFLNQLEPDDVTYNIPMAVRLGGPLNVEALEQSLNEIVRRHEALRTTFGMAEGHPVQVIAPFSEKRLPMVNLEGLPESEREVQARRLATEEALRPFDLAQSPLLRATLLRLGTQEHVLLLNMHHIVSDGWSIWIFQRELVALYRAFSAQERSTLPELPIQYADFAAWQRQWLKGKVLETQLAYWKQQLGGELPALNLPTDWPRPAVQTFRGATQSSVLPATLSEALRALSHHEGVTLFMTLLAAFKVLLYRYTGQQNITVGTPVANRNRTEIEELIGFFVNTLVLRSDLSGNPTFRDVLSQVREMALQAYDHQGLPFEKLIEELQPERDLSRTPLFQVMFALQSASGEAFELPGLTLSLSGGGGGTAKFDLTLTVIDAAQELRVFFNYNTDLFASSTIARMMKHFEALLEDIVAHPGQRVMDLPLLTIAERHQMLVEWNDTAIEYPADRCIHQLFEAQVERTPDAIAVVFEEKLLTYGHLNTRANQLAHYLQALGVGPETLVGLCVERSLEMVVGILGVLKAGGAYVPLDPAYPQERLAFILQDTQAPVLLTQQNLVDRLLPHDARVLCLDADWETIAQADEKTLSTTATSHNLAYVIYTSGSTGKPKGVAIEHRSATALIHWAQHAFDTDIFAGTLASTSICFDLSIFELFVPLSCGGTIVLVQTILHLSTLPAAEKVTLINTVPSAMQEFLRMSEVPPSVRVVNLAGEPLQAQLVQRIYQQETVQKVFDLYGPSEDTTYSTHALRSAEGPDTIGRPIANTQVYLLDSHLRPVPVGVVGELHVGDAGLARGYLNRPDLTAEKFIPHPFSDKPGVRLYRTGDLARYLPDGNIEFLGRLDHQVKIRGFRIELGEIETVLGQHPSVQEAVVLAREKAGKRLVAYVTACDGHETSVSELRGYIRERLPSYMVPSVFVTLEALPLTPNGKVDRRMLPAPDSTRPELAEAFAAPRTPTESALAGIWAEVLGLDKVGIHDNFFELGGHSLQAAQVASKMSMAMDLRISVKLLFLRPTIKELAQAVEDLVQKRELPKRVSLEHMSDMTAQVAPRKEFPEQETFPLIQVEHRPLLSLFAAGKIAPVDAAAVGYFPASFLEETGLSRDEFIDIWCDNLPVFHGIMETRWGRIALIALPRFDFELYSDKDDLVSAITEALEMAGRLGARAVSLTGLIPSATDYGHAIAAAIADRKDLPAITTGHGTTSATIALSISRVLQEGGRDLTQERVGFIGLGSVGMSTLFLMLKCLPHPQEITLCDVYNKRKALERIRQEVMDNSGFGGDTRIALSQGEVPPEIYNATLIVGATNVPDILDITRVKPGTVIVDDSAPHCFVPQLAAQRFKAKEDILFTEGGILQSAYPISRLSYLPRHMKTVTRSTQAQTSKPDPFLITGCVFSSLLSARFEALGPTVGIVDASTCFEHYQILDQLGFRAAALHCGRYVLSEESIRSFRSRFGNSKPGDRQIQCW